MINPILASGAQGGTRTLTLSRAEVFETSVAAITPLEHIKRTLGAAVSPAASPTILWISEGFL